MGHLGVFWSIYTVLNIFGLILFFARVVLEFFYDTIERMTYSRRMFYYNAKSYISITFVINHAIAIGLSIILKADNLCDVKFSTYDTIYCNISQVHGMPMDSFVVIVFLLLLYQITLPIKYIYTFFGQVVQFIAVILAGCKVFKYNVRFLSLSASGGNDPYDADFFIREGNFTSSCFKLSILLL